MEAKMEAEKMEGVYQRGDTYWIRYSGPRPDGTWGQIRESAKTRDSEKAKKLLRNRLRGVANHRDGIRRFQGPFQERVTVDELLDNLERSYETRQLKSLRQVKVHAAHVRKAFGFEKAAAITRRRVEDYIASRREAKAAGATIDRETEILRRALTLGAEDGVVAFVPRVTRLVKGHANARQGFVERAELDAFVSELPSQVLRDVALWAYGTGMRKGEILSLTWAGYDRETRAIRLHARNSKTGRGRMVALDGWLELAEIIERRLSARRLDSPLIFHNGRGGRVGDFYTTWARAIGRAKVNGKGITPFTLHDFRRTAVRNMIRAGVPERVAMEISGHRTRAIFDRYNIVSERDLAEAMEMRAAYEAGLTTAKTT
jgi:integrase